MTPARHDGLARNTVTRHPDLTEKTLTFNALVQVERTDEKGQVTTYGYDARNRLDTVNYDDDGVIDRNYDYDLVGNILSVNEVEDYQDVGYTYDALNRIITETSNGLTHDYHYDLAGNRIINIYDNALGGNQLTLVSTYDALNRTATMFEDDNSNGIHDSGERISSYHYDLAGNIRTKDQPNGHNINKIYDALNRAYVIVGPDGADSLPLYQYDHQYDLFGSLTVIEEVYPSADSQLTDRIVVNTYDGVNRLTDESITTGSNTLLTTYSYDDAHNRTNKTVTNDDGSTITTLENASYVYSNSLNQIGSFTDSISNKSVSYAYDLNGNRTGILTDLDGDTVIDQATVYDYDHENRLLQHHKTEGSDVDIYNYGYDYRTRRVLRDETAADDASQVNGNKTYVVFSGGLSVQEWSNGDATHTINPANDTLEVQYIRGSDYGGGIGGILYTLRDLDSGGVINDASFNHYNSRGDVVAKAVDDGSLIYQAAYEAFGKHGDTPSSQDWGTNPDRQQGNTKDEDPTGLLNEGFRYRDLETGTFITRDPLGFVDGPNVYTYVVQNPWTKFDPLGLEWSAVTTTTVEAILKTVIVNGQPVQNADGSFRETTTTKTSHHTKLTFKANLVDDTKSGSVDLAAQAEAIKSGIESIWKGTETLRDNNSGTETHTWDTEVVINTDQSASDNYETTIAIVDDIVDKDGKAYGQVNRIPGNSMLLDKDNPLGEKETGINSQRKVAAHEAGHLGGLRHDNDPDQTTMPNKAEARNNIMNRAPVGTDTNSAQVKKIEKTANDEEK